MKLIRNKFIIGILCIAIGVTAGFILLPKSQNSEISMTQVVRLTQNVKAGEKLTTENLETTTIPAASVPGGASSSADVYRGKYAVTQLFAGDILTATKVRDTLVDPVAAGAAKGKQLVSLTVPTLTAGVSGTLLPGDVVAIMVTSKVTQFNQQLGLLVATEQSTVTAPESEDGEAQETGDPSSGISQTLYSSIQKESETFIPEELRYLEVCKITASDGTDALVNTAKDPDVPNRLPATITFYATEKQALKLAEIEQNDDIHIAFLARGDAADVFIPRDERVLVEEPIPESTPEPTEAPPSATSQPTRASEAPQENTTPETTVLPSATDEPSSTSEPEPAETAISDGIDDPANIDFNDPGVGE